MGRRHRWPRVGTGLLGLLFLGQPAHAVEYRLLVASVFDTSLTSFVTANELTYGASGPGLPRLETAISTGGIEPTSYRAVISWADPDIDRESPRMRNKPFHRYALAAPFDRAGGP